MHIKQVDLETVCGITSALPENTAPEFAFAGKSNVGKSSLINGLVNRKAYARVSNKPGKTQTINFYRVGAAGGKASGDKAPAQGEDISFYLVDLPGYGFAKRPKEEIAKWGPMVERYLHGSRQLKAVFLLVDIRHLPSENDMMMYDWIRAQGFSPYVIATKADKLNKSEFRKQVPLLAQAFSLPPEEGRLLTWSALTKEGRDAVYAVMEGLMA